MRDKIAQFDDIAHKWDEVNEKLDAKRGILKNNDKVITIKKAIKDLNMEVRRIEERIGVIQAMVSNRYMVEIQIVLKIAIKRNLECLSIHL